MYVLGYIQENIDGSFNKEHCVSHLDPPGHV